METPYCPTASSVVRTEHNGQEVVLRLVHQFLDGIVSYTMGENITTSI